MRRLVLLVAAVLVLASGCAVSTTGPLLSDAERCARFGGIWRGGSSGTCHGGN